MIAFFWNNLDPDELQLAADIVKQRDFSSCFQSVIACGLFEGKVKPNNLGHEVVYDPFPDGKCVVSALSETTSQGLLDGDYQWKITYVNSALAEGDVGTGIATVARPKGRHNHAGQLLLPEALSRDRQADQVSL